MSNDIICIQKRNPTTPGATSGTEKDSPPPPPCFLSRRDHLPIFPRTHITRSTAVQHRNYSGNGLWLSIHSKRQVMLVVYKRASVSICPSFRLSVRHTLYISSLHLCLSSCFDLTLTDLQGSLWPSSSVPYAYPQLQRPHLPDPPIM